MKNIYKLLITTVVLLTGCEKDNTFFFDNDNTALQLWFGTSTQVQDSVSFNFSYMTSNRDSVIFNARILGYPFDKDVEFELEPVAGHADLVDYTIPKLIIKAGQTEVNFPIYFERPDNYQEFQNKAGYILFKLKANSLFKDGNKETTSLRISLKNSLAKPDNWDSAIFPYLPLKNYFGDYSNKKLAFMIEHLNVTYYNVYSSSNISQNTDPEAISSTTATFYRSVLRQKLTEYNDSPKGPLLDENLFPVTF